MKKDASNPSALRIPGRDGAEWCGPLPRDGSPSSQDALLTLLEAAARLRVSVCTIRRWIRRGALVAVRLPGGLLRVRAADVDNVVCGDVRCLVRESSTPDTEGSMIPIVRLRQRGRSYQLDYRTPAGARVQVSVGGDLAQATALQQQWGAWLREGKTPREEMRRRDQAARARSLTVAAFWVIFQEHHIRHKSVAMQRQYGTVQEHLTRQGVWDLPLSEVTVPRVLEYRQARLAAEVKPATVNREVACLKALLQKAERWEYLDRNRLQGLDMLPEGGKIEVYTTPAELAALVEALTPAFGRVVLFAVYTGMRRDEILGLRVRDVEVFDLGPLAGRMTVTVKGNRRETFPLSRRAADLVRAAIAGADPARAVFVNPATGAPFTETSQAFYKAVRRLGLNVYQDGQPRPFRFHDLRHLFISWLAAEGVPLDRVRDLVGHRLEATTRIYRTLERLQAGAVLDRIPEIPVRKTGSL